MTWRFAFLGTASPTHIHAKYVKKIRSPERWAYFLGALDRI